jgi:ribulose-5-phosphate 4-epimerase/fuculose-1-phosphate aldolase
VTPVHADIDLAREEICRVGASLFARGYVHATAGNVSMRLADDAGGGFLITPTDACLGTLRPNDLAHVAEDGTPISGARPSKTLALHRRIYAAAPHARCVIHTHSTHLVALTLRGVWRDADVLPPITPYFVMKVGHVPLVPYFRPGDPRVAEWVAGSIAAHAVRGIALRAVLCDRLGPQVWESSPAAAMAVLEELEETARIWLLSGGQAAPLSDAQLAELHAEFGVRW